MESTEDLALQNIADQQKEDAIPSQSNSELTGSKRNMNRKRRRLEIDQQDEENGFVTIPKFIHKDGIRYVEKYTHVFRGYTKNRWLGKPLYQVCWEEFKSYSNEYYLDAIKSGKVKVNNQIASPEYIMKHNDQLQHFAERIETPILDEEIKIVEDNDDFVIVDKPASMPIHPWGNYKYNTLKFILEQNYGYKDLRVVHRLDKQTSGILFMAKNLAAANEFQANLMKEREIKKVYFARVRGKIDLESPFTVNQPIFWINNSYYDTQPANDSKDQGKDAETEFEILFYDEASNTTVVKWYPITGRTHQIRVHLKFIGHPIANDDNYGGIIYNDCGDVLKKKTITTTHDENLEEEMKEIRDVMDTKLSKNDDILTLDLLNGY